MQAQTTRKRTDTLSKLASGLLITAALAAGAIGLTTVGELEIPGTGSNTATVTTSVADRHFAPYFGEGLPRIEEASAVAVERVSTSRQLDAPQGEGYPLSREIPAIIAEPAGSLTHTRQLDAPQGEGFPMIERQQRETPFNPQGEGLITGNGQ